MPLNIYTFNVLNPNISVSNIVFRCAIDGDFKTKMEISKHIAEVDLIRYNKYRENIIISMIKSWLTQESIICLQEVCEELLKSLKKHKFNIVHTKTKDMVIFSGSNILKDEYRVIILSKHLKLTSANELEIKTTIIQKNAIYINAVTSTGTTIQCICMHMHWKNGIDEIKHISENIKHILTDAPYFICGDFNNIAISPLMIPFIADLSNVYNMKDLKNIENKYTSITSNKELIMVPIYENLENSVVKDTVFGICSDYIIAGNIPSQFKIGEQNIITEYDKKYILYDMPRIENNNKLGIFNTEFYDTVNNSSSSHLQKIYNKYAKLWIAMNKKTKHMDISDHLPVVLSISH